MFPKASSSLAERSAHAFPLVVIGQSLIETVITSVIIFIEVQAGAQQVEILVIMLRQHQQEGLDHILENTKRIKIIISCENSCPHTQNMHTASLRTRLINAHIFG